MMITQNPTNIKFIKNPCHQIQIIAINHNIELFNDIDFPCGEAQIYAVKKDKKLFEKLKKPCTEAIIEYYK